MSELINKLKKILENILNYLKSIISIIFKFFFDLFNNNENSNELKSTKLDDAKKEVKKENTHYDASGYNEEPTSKAISHETKFIMLDSGLEKLILERFCEELEIEEKNLSINEKEYLKSLNEKLIPLLQNDINIKRINNKNVLINEVKTLVVKELENQFILEQSNTLPPQKVIITPLLAIPTIKPALFNKPTFLALKKYNIASKQGVKTNEPLANNTPTNKEVLPASNPLEGIKEIKQDTTQVTFSSEKSFVSNFNSEKSFNPPSFNNNPIIESLNEELEQNIPDTASNDNSSDIPEIHLGNIMEANNEISNPKIEPTLNEEKENTPTKSIPDKKADKQEEIFQEYDYQKMEKSIQNTIYQINEEIKKEELEDKNYELLENQINSLLNEISILKLKNLSPQARNKLIVQENKLLQLRISLDNQKQKDISLEEANLEQSILNEDLVALEAELEKLHIEDKLDLQYFMINNLEELDNMTFDKAKEIEKELLKIKLKKAIHDAEVPSLLALPFIHNKYFMFFTGGLLINRHLKFFDAILKRKSIEFEPEEISHIKTGSNAFTDAIDISKQNIEYLDYLKEEAFRKYPELRFDVDYILKLNKLKNKLLKRQERLLRKETIFQKHNLKLKRNIRKLKKKENQI